MDEEYLCSLSSCTGTDSESTDETVEKSVSATIVKRKPNEDLGNKSAVDKPPTKRLRFDSDNRNNERFHFLTASVLRSPNNSKWTVVNPGNKDVARRSQKNVLKEQSGPTPNAKRNIDKEFVSSAWRLRLIIDNTILKHTKKCTEVEARRKLKDETWCISLDELYAFLGVWYVRGATGAKGLDVRRNLELG